MTIRPYYILAYISSQILNRYLRVQCPETFISRDSENTFEACAESWTRTRWYDFIKKERLEPSGLLPWISSYFSKMDPEGLLLLDKTVEHLEWLQKANARMLLLCDKTYPSLLRAIPQAPLAINIMGDLNLLKSPKVSVIGSRRTSHLILKECYKLGYELAQLGIGVVSGGAFGCDISTHLGVLASQKRPLPAIVVFANGLHKLYPRAHQRTFDEILYNGGLLVSERLWNQSPKPYDFPTRNRIISGLSMSTIVMGADIRSGAMVTARFALDQGREVSVFYPEEVKSISEGCRELIEDGAQYFRNSEEFFSQVLK